MHIEDDTLTLQGELTFFHSGYMGHNAENAIGAAERVRAELKLEGFNNYGQVRFPTAYEAKHIARTNVAHVKASIRIFSLRIVIAVILVIGDNGPVSRMTPKPHHPEFLNPSQH